MKIAIDGPAGAGKSSVAKEVARRLGIKYLDTGAMYRALTLKSLKNNVDLNNESTLIEQAKNSNLQVKYDEEIGNLIFLDGKDITHEIRSSEVNKHVSIVAKYPEVRKELVNLQRKVAKESGPIVMEGRDIGTNVLFDADYKLFLTADIRERAKRRWIEMKSKGIETPFSFEELVEEISNRDRLDSERKDFPLKKASDAILIDTTSYSLEEVVKKVINIIKENEKANKSERTYCHKA